ncbi:MAG: hypothetical protein P4M07_04075 [Xanthobacteraceae bacterium]|nr:hypothetical protein [Xanthobacteraceae bacterium]
MSGHGIDGQITRQGAAYRQGLVLGLTMAEIMILLIFCLLIAMATVLHSEQGKRGILEHVLKEQRERSERDQPLVEALRRNPDLVERLQAAIHSGNAHAVDEFWRELIDGRALVVQAEQGGMSSAELSERVADAATLRDNGVDLKTALRNADIIRSIERVMPAADAAKSPQSIIEAVQRGVAGPVASGHRWPPIITLSEAGGFFFGTGSAELSPGFRAALTTETPRTILDFIKQYDVDVIEVVGHTDEQPLSGVRVSNLDSEMSSVLQNTAAVAHLVPADNAGLGLARAVSVVSVLRQSPLLAGYKIIPLSGAQLVNIDETLDLSATAADIPQRRRIEIRLRKSAPHEMSVAAPADPTAAPRPLPIQPRPSSPGVTPRPNRSLLQNDN